MTAYLLQAQEFTQNNAPIMMHQNLSVRALFRQDNARMLRF